MDIGSINVQKSTAELGNLLKNIVSQEHGMSEKLIRVNTEQKVANENLGNKIDYIA
ncbi:MAG: hypothetical protein ACOC2H_07240 [Spirochaetota bacterium]